VAGSQADRQIVTEVHQLSTLAELTEAVDLQQQVWGFDDRDVAPLPLFVVAAETGGQVFGAFDGGRMVGFCLAFVGIKPGGRLYLHSHMLAVLPEYRDQGVGRQLKLQQRSEALGRAIDLIEWTFDPLQLKNAYFNIVRLGAIARRYLENISGESSSPLHADLPTDRLIAEWWLDRPKEASRPVGDIEERISIPVAIDRIRREDPARAREIQLAAATRFQHCFAKGFAVIGFERGEREGVYLLGEAGPTPVSETGRLRQRISEIERKALRNLGRGPEAV
jgi:predicted GNAT superfamily acetyltransferase